VRLNSLANASILCCFPIALRRLVSALGSAFILASNGRPLAGRVCATAFGTFGHPQLDGSTYREAWQEEVKAGSRILSTRPHPTQARGANLQRAKRAAGGRIRISASFLGGVAPASGGSAAAQDCPARLSTHHPPASRGHSRRLRSAPPVLVAGPRRSARSLVFHLSGIFYAARNSVPFCQIKSQRAGITTASLLLSRPARFVIHFFRVDADSQCFAWWHFGLLACFGDISEADVRAFRSIFKE